ncbi:MAG: hypothetical protein KGI67_11910, partial [Pseudomonadota bacterium]|nr:hypothetical protein [Pseudomonadota bacterium]
DLPQGASPDAVIWQRTAHVARILADAGLVVIVGLPGFDATVLHAWREVLGEHPVHALACHAGMSSGELTLRSRALLRDHPRQLPG